MTALAALYALATALLVVQGLRLLGLAVGRLSTSPEAAAPEPLAWPGVCVQLPVYNEPEVVERAIDALASLDYPAMELQVLDDSTDATTERAARAVARLRASGVDAVHLRRGSREGFKAGALAAGMEQTDADLFAIFDADFLPEPDTLRRLVAPLVADPGLAFAQARWAHLNRTHSALTRAQGALLDVHFAVEQASRQRLGRFLPFNGTAGVWRREAVEAAGGWRGTTLAEDLDLSLRAWMGGARGRFVEPMSVPAELPEALPAWRKQQARWAEGMSAVTRLHTRRLLTATRQPLILRLRALLAISAPLAYPALLVMLLLHPVLAAAHALGSGPGEAFFTALGVGWLGLLGAVAAHIVAQQAVGSRGLWRRMVDIGLGLAAPVSLALTGTRAVARGLTGRRTAFARTPKGGVTEATPTDWAETALAIYALGGAVVLAGLGAWVALAFQIVFAGTLAASAWGESRSGAVALSTAIPARR